MNWSAGQSVMIWVTNKLSMTALCCDLFFSRDLKVDNVMISAEKKVKLIDFGFLCALGEGEEEFLGPQTGTIGYFAPESIPLSGYSVFSAKSDIWYKVYHDMSSGHTTTC